MSQVILLLSLIVGRLPSAANAHSARAVAKMRVEASSTIGFSCFENCSELNSQNIKSTKEANGVLKVFITGPASTAFSIVLSPAIHLTDERGGSKILDIDQIKKVSNSTTATDASGKSRLSVEPGVLQEVLVLSMGPLRGSYTIQLVY